jgi:hypothetical protein
MLFCIRHDHRTIEHLMNTKLSLVLSIDHPPLLTERLTTTPLTTGPVMVLINVKTFCSSVSGALAT